MAAARRLGEARRPGSGVSVVCCWWRLEPAQTCAGGHGQARGSSGTVLQRPDHRVCVTVPTAGQPVVVGKSRSRPKAWPFGSWAARMSRSSWVSTRHPAHAGNGAVRTTSPRPPAGRPGRPPAASTAARTVALMRSKSASVSASASLRQALRAARGRTPVVDLGPSTAIVPPGEPFSRRRGEAVDHSRFPPPVGPCRRPRGPALPPPRTVRQRRRRVRHRRPGPESPHPRAQPPAERRPTPRCAAPVHEPAPWRDGWSAPRPLASSASSWFVDGLAETRPVGRVSALGRPSRRRTPCVGCAALLVSDMGFTEIVSPVAMLSRLSWLANVRTVVAAASPP